MGSGKSYVGQRFATALGLDFVDLDALIEAEEGLSVGQIFEQFGEQSFRQKESFYLKSLLSEKNKVIATGGGAPCFFDNMTWMNAHGITIYLKPSISLLVQRLGKEREHRPILKKIQSADLEGFILQKIRERSSFYEQAQHTIVFDESNEHNLVTELLQITIKPL